MSYLSRIDLSIEDLEKIGPMDSYRWHQAIWGCFPGRKDDKRDFLTRIDELDGKTQIWILSPAKPAKPGWCPDGALKTKELAKSFLGHGRYAFDLKANPTKRMSVKGEDGKSPRGKRVLLTKPDALREWLHRKGEANGFILSDETPLEIGPVSGCHYNAKGNESFHGEVQFKGVLEVANTEKFVEGYHKGIGTAKGFGCGLLLIKPI